MLRLGRAATGIGGGLGDRHHVARVQALEAPLVERERELEELERLPAAARRGEGAAAIVEGPAGIGKTRLLAAAGAAAEDLEVLRARASELEHDFPFGVVRQLFEPVLFAAGEGRRSRLLAGAGRLAERVLSGAAVPDGGVSGDPFAVLHGLYWFAANLAGLRPLLLLVDDAQLADAASLRWLAFLLHRLEGVPLALLLGVRTGEAGSQEALLDELTSDPGLRIIQPAALSGHAVAQLVERALGAAPDAAFLSACQRATAGNPFLVRELLVVLTAPGCPPDGRQRGGRRPTRLQPRRAIGPRPPASAARPLPRARTIGQRARRRVRADGRGQAGGAGRAGRRPGR